MLTTGHNGTITVTGKNGGFELKTSANKSQNETRLVTASTGK
jgi:hypothetical protein